MTSRKVILRLGIAKVWLVRLNVSRSKTCSWPRRGPILQKQFLQGDHFEIVCPTPMRKVVCLRELKAHEKAEKVTLGR
jgi:hypothetical protein